MSDLIEPFDDVTHLPRPVVLDAFGRQFGITVAGLPQDGSNAQPAIAAAIAAAPSGALLRVPAGDYYFGAEITNQGKSIRLELDAGATFYKDFSGARLVTFTGAWDATVAITSMTSGTVTEAAVVQNTVTVTHSGTMPWKRGDVVKVFSDDLIPGTRGTQADSSIARSGQFMTVYSVASGSTTFQAKLRDDMSTNLRMARLQPMTASIRGGQFDMTDRSITNNWTGEMLGMVALNQPSVRDLTIRRSPSQAISMVSNIGYSIENVNVLWAWNDGSTRYGYGVNDNASTGGHVSKCFFGQVRHGFTDSNAEIAAGNTNPSVYGRSIGWTVSDVIVDSATSSAFDSHAGGQGGTFANCTAYSSSIGFALRGRQHRIIGGRTFGCAQVARLFSEQVGGDCWGHDIEINGDDASVGMLELINNLGADNPNLGVRETRGHRVKMVGTRIQGYRVKAYNIVAQVDVSMEMTGAVVSGQGIDYFQNAKISGEMSLDVSGTTGSGAVLHDLTTSVDSEVELVDRVLGFSNQSTRIAKIFQNTPTSIIRSKGGANYPITTISDALTTNSYLDWESLLNRPGSSTSLVSLTSAALSTTSLLAVARSRSTELTLEVTMSASATLPQLPAAAVQGQRLLIVNSSASTSSTVLTISNGATPRTELIGAAAKTLSVGQSILLSATSAGIWKQIAAVV